MLLFFLLDLLGAVEPTGKLYCKIFFTSLEGGLGPIAQLV